MKYQIRKVEEITIWQATEVATLDPKKFKKLEDDPYTGNTEEEFLAYITKFINNCRWDGFPYDLDEKTKDELDKLVENINWTEYANSAEKGETSWIQLGRVNPEYRRTGGFEVLHQTE